MRESFRAIRIRLALSNAYLKQTISGMSIVQLCTREPRAYTQFDDLNTDLLQANQGAIRAMSLFFPAVTFTRAGAAAAIFIAGGYWALGGQMTIGTLLAFWQLLDQFFRPLQAPADKYN